MDFEAVVEELYAGGPAEFVTTRDARAREAKAAGDAALADRIRALRKPTAAAAAVNRIARDHPAMLAELAELGAKLRKAHAELDGGELRALTRQRHLLVNRALNLERTLSEPVTREVEATLEAVVSNADAAEAAALGRLTAALHPDSGDQWLAAATVAPSKRPKLKLVPKPVEKRQTKRSAKQPEDPAERARQRREAVESAKARDQAHADLIRARRRADRADEAAETLRERLAEAEKAGQEARQALAAAQAAFDKAERAAKVRS